MTKRVLALTFVLMSCSFAGPMLGGNESTLQGTEYDAVSVDLSAVPMDDIEVMPQAVATFSTAASLRDAIAAAVIAAPEPATFAATAAALLIAGAFRCRRKQQD